MENQNIITKDKASRAIIIHDDGILLMFRHQLKPTWEIKEYYVTIGWWAEWIETSEQTLRRASFVQKGDENNSYEIQKVTWSELPKINLIPKDLHWTIVEYAYKNWYL